jgi:hypothetical protein
MQVVHEYGRVSTVDQFFHSMYYAVVVQRKEAISRIKYNKN